MSLKYMVDTLDGVPDAVRPLYAEKDGKFVLAVDGVVPKEKLDEFRDNNIALRRDMDAMRAKFDGIDPDEARKLAEQAQKQRDKKLVDAGRVDELLAERVAAMKAEFDKQTGTLASERDKLSTQLGGLVVDGAIRDAAMKAGVRPTAVEDVLLRGRVVFRLQDGKAVAFDGDKPLFGKAGEPLDVTEWVNGLADRAPHLFEPSRGAGTPPAGSGGRAPAGTIARGDHAAFLANLDKIVSGAVKVI